MSEGIGELVKALCAAKKAIQAPKKGNTAEAGKYSYRYADRHDVIESYAAALAENGLQIIHIVRTDENLHMRQVSILAHSSGQQVESCIPIPNVPNAQALGSWLTYLERYHSCALLDIAADSDEDGAGATGSVGASSETSPRKPADAEREGKLLDGGNGSCPACATVVAPWRNAGKDGSHFCPQCRKPFHATKPADAPEEVPTA